MRVHEKKETGGPFTFVKSTLLDFNEQKKKRKDPVYCQCTELNLFNRPPHTVT